jgi:hypothetical protein
MRVHVWWMTSVVLVGCSDDSGIADGGDTSGTSGTTTSTTLGTSSTDVSATMGQSVTSADVSSSEASATTLVDTDTQSESSSDSGHGPGSESSTGGDPDPFGEPMQVALDPEIDALSLEIGDFDGDGVVDLVATGTTGGTVAASTLLGDGRGSFASGVDAGITACSAFPIVGTIDDDPRGDLFFGTCVDELVFWRGQAAGVFAAASPMDAWTEPAIVASRFSDHGADGLADLVLLTNGDGTALHLALRDDLGPWPVTSVPLDIPGFVANRMKVGDLDGDDALDVVLVEVDESVVVVLDAFGAPQVEVLALDVSPWNVELVDLDGDGVLDLAVTSVVAPAVELLVGDGAGGFVALTTDLGLGDVAPFDAAFGDFDGDGLLDVAAVDDDSATIAYALRDGDGLGAWSTRTLSGLAVRVHAADLDGNGADDLVAGVLGDGVVDVLLSQ